MLSVPLKAARSGADIATPAAEYMAANLRPAEAEAHREALASLQALRAEVRGLHWHAWNRKLRAAPGRAATAATAHCN